MKMLVTGASGFVGQYVTKMIPNSVAFSLSVDLRRESDVESAIRELEFDSVLHLAGQSAVQESFREPMATFDINFLGTYRLLNVLQKINFKGRFLQIGSGDMYGVVQESDLPIRETQPLRPRNPYAVSKVAAEALCFQMCQSSGLDIVMARPFNHIGPGQNEQFAVSNFARQIVEIKNGARDPVMNVGDLSATRDFSDVRDVVRAYQLLIERGQSGEIYNVCSGSDVSMMSIVERLCRLASISLPEIRIEGARLRPTDSLRVVGSNEKINKATGWKSQIELEQSLKDMLDYWEAKLQ